jgi:hypothetical protein
MALERAPGTPPPPHAGSNASAAPRAFSIFSTDCDPLAAVRPSVAKDPYAVAFDVMGAAAMAALDYHAGCDDGGMAHNVAQLLADE